MTVEKIVKKILVNPFTQKRQKSVWVAGKGWFRWNAEFRVYNAVSDYSQLQCCDVCNIEWNFRA
jgi:hypothetical protein